MKTKFYLLMLSALTLTFLVGCDDDDKKDAPLVEVSQNYLEMEAGATNSSTVTIAGEASGVKVSNNEILDASLDGKNIVLKAKKAGSTNVVVMNNDLKTTTLQVVVYPKNKLVLSSDSLNISVYDQVKVTATLAKGKIQVVSLDESVAQAYIESELVSILHRPDIVIAGYKAGKTRLIVSDERGVKDTIIVVVNPYDTKAVKGRFVWGRLSKTEDANALFKAETDTKISKLGWSFAKQEAYDFVTFDGDLSIGAKSNGKLESFEYTFDGSGKVITTQLDKVEVVKIDLVEKKDDKDKVYTVKYVSVLFEKGIRKGVVVAPIIEDKKK